MNVFYQHLRYLKALLVRGSAFSKIITIQSLHLESAGINLKQQKRLLVSLRKSGLIKFSVRKRINGTLSPKTFRNMNLAAQLENKKFATIKDRYMNAVIYDIELLAQLK